MATSEIEKLERRYAENPHGLTFAPLAEVHRKNGDVTRALELLRIGLELHPNYIPASIVLGRCHQDLGDLPAAAEAFAHVLRLDDENVIALKSLADINERQDRLDEAERWLRRLVSVDRSNEEARQQLQRVEAALEKVSRDAPSPAPAISEAREKVRRPEETAHEPAPVEVKKPEPSVPPPAPPPLARVEPAEIAPLDLTDDLKKEPAAPAPFLEPSALNDRGRASSPDATPEGFVLEPEPPAPAPTAPLPGLETSEFEPPKAPLGPLGLEIETESDVVLNSSGASEFSVPDASQDFAALAAKMNASRPRNPGRRASDRVAPEAREPAKVTEAPAAAGPIRVPGPAEETPPSPPAPAKTYSVRETKGQSIAAFFQALLVARPPADAGPSRSDPRGTDRSDSGSSMAAARPEVPSATPKTDQGKDGLVSFDDFFGSSGDRSVTASGEPGKDDLDQFQTWLQNLKR